MKGLKLVVMGAAVLLIIVIMVGCPNGGLLIGIEAKVDMPLMFPLTMINVPAGSFQRDSDAANISMVSTFQMSRHEITRAQFKAIMGTDPSYIPRSSGTDDPVQRASWFHAIAFCNKLSIAEGLTPVYTVTGINNWAELVYENIPTSSNDSWNATTANWDANGYRLPTEMEWMWAAMGAPVDGQDGGTNTTGYSKDFAGSTGSNALGDYAVCLENSGPGDTIEEPRTTRAVGSKLPNELGLYDMSGNVYEWCWDLTSDYPSGQLMDYRGATSSTNRVSHGGCWESSSNCAVAHRNSTLPYTQFDIRGFRVVRP